LLKKQGSLNSALTVHHDHAEISSQQRARFRPQPPSPSLGATLLAMVILPVPVAAVAAEALPGLRNRVRDSTEIAAA